jgi:hypothetical protein
VLPCLLQPGVCEGSGHEVSRDGVRSEWRLNGVKGASVVLGRMELVSREGLEDSCRLRIEKRVTYLVPGSWISLLFRRFSVLKFSTTDASGSATRIGSSISAAAACDADRVVAVVANDRERSWPNWGFSDFLSNSRAICCPGRSDDIVSHETSSLSLG